MPTQSLESAVFRTANQIVEPIARSGCFSPYLWATGLILLETTGRHSGKLRQTPVLAMMMDGHLIVRTFRGERSDWFKNLRANPKVSYWSGGDKQQALALVHVPGEECQTKMLPPAVALGVGTTRLAVQLLGWRFAVLSPR